MYHKCESWLPAIIETRVHLIPRSVAKEQTRRELWWQDYSSRNNWSSTLCLSSPTCWHCSCVVLKGQIHSVPMLWLQTPGCSHSTHANSPPPPAPGEAAISLEEESLEEGRVCTWCQMDTGSTGQISLFKPYSSAPNYQKMGALLSGSKWE